MLVRGDRAYEVEFATLDGVTLAVVSLDASCVRPISATDDAASVGLFLGLRRTPPH